MFSIIKSRIYKVSLEVVLLLLFCCMGFAEGTRELRGEDTFTLTQELAQSQRLLIKDNDKQYFLLKPNGGRILLTPPMVTVKDKVQGQKLLLKSGYIYCFCEVDESLPPPERRKVSFFLTSSRDTVILTRDGNSLLIANKNEIKLYHIDLINKCLSPTPTSTIIPDPEKEIMPETVAANYDGSYIDFKQRPKESSETGTAAFISDDGFRKLQDGKLYTKETSGWDGGCELKNPYRSDLFDSVSIGHSNNLLYFAFYWSKFYDQSYDRRGLYYYDGRTLKSYTEQTLDHRFDKTYLSATVNGDFIQWSPAKDFDNFSLSQVLPLSQRLVLKEDGNPKKLFLLNTDNSFIDLSTIFDSDFELFQAADNNIQTADDYKFIQTADDIRAADNIGNDFMGQKFLLRGHGITNSSYYFYQLNEAYPPSSVFFFHVLDSNDTVMLTRDGNSLLIANKNEIKLYHIDLINKCLSPTPTSTIISDPEKEIMPETVAANRDGSYIDFKQQPIGYFNPGTTPFISDDGSRKLQDGKLYIRGTSVWDNGHQLPSAPVPASFIESRYCLYSSNLQYFTSGYKIYDADRQKECIDIWIYRYNADKQTFDIVNQISFSIPDCCDDVHGKIFYSVANDGKFIVWKNYGSSTKL